MTATTAFGPQGPNYSTVRPPADPKASGGVDTFFKNCSAAGAKDGTFATADFFNVQLANLRYLVRTAGIALDDADDTMVYKAVQAIAGGGVGGNGINYGVDTGAVNQIETSITSVASYFPGLVVFIKVGSTNTAATSLNINGMGAKPVWHPNGTDLIPKDLIVGEIAMFVFDGTAFQLQTNPASAQTPLYFTANAAGTATFVNSVVSLGNDFSLIDSSLADATFVNGVLTVGAKSAGVWSFYTNMGIATPLNGWTMKVELYKNTSVLFAHTETTESGTNATQNISVSGLIRLAPGDTVGAYAVQNTASNQVNSTLSKFAGSRISS